uniref:glycosyltransferase family 4 protein n=1 Tax=Lachnospira sp. TaxID=2049031 RepID=UPI003FF11785
MRFLAAGPYVQRMISTYMNTESEILNFGVKEERGTDAIQAYYNEHNIVRFLLAGTLSSLKGIDVLAEAIRTLPEVYHERSEYIFVGNMSTAEEGILEDLLTLDNEYDNVKIYDSLNHDDIYRLYDKVSVVVVPSRLEPTSAVAVEGLMKRKICICTDICGVSYYLENGKNAIIIPAGNSEVLAEKIKYVIDNVADLKYMCDAGY